MTFFAYTLKLARFGFSVWVRLFGRKRATKLVLGGAAVSTVVVVVLQSCGG